MTILIFILSIFVFLKTFYYGLYEFKQNNKVGASFVIVLSFVSLIGPNIMMLFRK